MLFLFVLNSFSSPYCAVTLIEPVLEVSSIEVSVLTGSLLVNMSLIVGGYMNIIAPGYPCHS